MKIKQIKYFLVFLLLILKLEAFAQLDHHYLLGRKAKEQSQQFPNKLIHLRNKYVFDQKVLREKNTISLLKNMNDPKINI